VWLIEGLLVYMNETVVRNLSGIAGALTAPRSLLDVDLVSRDHLTSPTMRPLLAAFAGRGASGLRHQRPGGAVGRVRLGGGSNPTRRVGR
jgi:hypothetical protein